MLRAASIALCVSLLPLSAHAENVSEAAVSIVDSFENIFGVTKGKRRNHTKGFCFEAEFIPADPAIRDYTVSPIFKQTSPVIGRLSHSGGNNSAADDKPADYGLAIKIVPADDGVHIISGKKKRLKNSYLAADKKIKERLLKKIFRLKEFVDQLKNKYRNFRSNEVQLSWMGES